jgi:hypothetical protein
MSHNSRAAGLWDGLPYRELWRNLGLMAVQRQTSARP